ncbi:cytochrome P450 [Halorubellus sp. JP-L1]|uniref:cytochrome P450 n=1 Tax=Halorubellus sp. JP-L1 TaxID=2715753 RepID=UPI00140C7421|nr:cytochrome P450 [Halorubellus sp. JP-L1]NHN41022.1 cytochrome P450 [Halorubellus sp. JP-L1]
MSDARNATVDGSSEEDDRPASGSDRGRADTVSNARRPPHVDGLPVVGCTLGVVRDALDFGERLFERGDVVSYDAFGRRFVGIADPDAIESILVSRNDAFRKGEFETEFGAIIAADGLAFTEGEQWRRQRNALQGSFTPATVQGFADDIVDRASAMAADWTATPGDVALRDQNARFALDVLARTLLDVDLDDERGDVVSTAADAISDYASPASLAVPDWIPLPAEHRYRRAMADLDALVDDLVAERRADANASGDFGDDLLGTMLAAVADGGDGDGVDADDAGVREDELRDQLVTFLFAGHETTATALTYAVWLVAGHPRVRERLDAELDAVLDGGDPSFADVPQLSYAEAVVEEALRLYPPVTTIYREAKSPTTVDGYRVHPGEVLQLSTYHVHRDDRWWDAPAEFRPERWLDDADATVGGLDPDATVAGLDADVDAAAFGREDRPEYAFFPFGGGPRHCIGMRFARLELRLALATLANRLEFEQVGGFDPTVKIALDPGDVRIRARERR